MTNHQILYKKNNNFDELYKKTLTFEHINSRAMFLNLGETNVKLSLNLYLNRDCCWIATQSMNATFLNIISVCDVVFPFILFHFGIHLQFTPTFEWSSKIKKLKPKLWKPKWGIWKRFRQIDTKLSAAEKTIEIWKLNWKMQVQKVTF